MDKRKRTFITALTAAAAAVVLVFVLLHTGSHDAEASEITPAVPVQAAPVQTAPAPVRAPSQTMFDWCRGKTLSILGDSICTFDGYIPAGYDTWYPKSYLDDINSTWWIQFLALTGMQLGTNDSWSGSLVSADPDGKNNQYITDRRLSSLMIQDPAGGPAKAPDVILVMGGGNDFSEDITPGTYTGTLVSGAAPSTFAEGFEYLLRSLEIRYPQSQLIVCTVPPMFSDRQDDSNTTPKHNDVGLTLEDYNVVVRAAAAAHGIPCVDMDHAGLVEADLPDGIHHNKLGASKMAVFISEYLKLIPAQRP